MSATVGAMAAAKKTVTPTTAIQEQFSRHVVRLGQNLTINVKVGAKGSAPATGTVELLSKGTPITTLDGPLTLTLNASGSASYTFAAGNLEFFSGIYYVKAQYLGDATHPSATSKVQTLYVITPPFRKDGKQGLEFSTVNKGKGGKAVVTGDTVNVAYTGLLASDGTIFDYATGHGAGSTPYLQYTVESQPEQVIPGFDEGTLGMKIGETRVIYIPYALGYGSEGSGTSIPAFADLIFIVTLLKIM